MVITMLTPECIAETMANKASYNCTDLGLPLVNMNLAEGNRSITCETQPSNNDSPAGISS